MQLYESNECCLSFRIVFICFHLLPVLINASLSVCVSVYNFHCFLPQQSDGLSAMRLLIQIDCQTIRTHTHTLSMFVCVCALITSTDLSMYNGTSIHECVCVTAKLLIVFSFVFCFACMCDDFFFLVKSADVFASLLCVYLP